MFEKVSQIAAQAATNVSRREFLGRLGRGALVAAGAAASFVAFGSEAQAGRRCCTSDADCRSGHICEAGRCVKGVRPPQACGTDSQAACVGKVEGQWCPAGTRSGRCVGAPNCRCQVVDGGRGGGRGGR
jgi:hypothetical protein